MSASPCRAAWLLLVLGLAGCAVPASPEPPRLARVEGRVALAGPASGAAWLFLFAPDEAPPEHRGSPQYMAAVSEVRLTAGDTRFGFSGVRPASYRLWGFLDANADVDPTVDVLAQPGLGDWVPETSVALDAAAGEGGPVELALTRRVGRPLPAFSVEGQGMGGVLTLTDAATQLTSFTVRGEGLVAPRGEASRFFLKLADANGDGTPDDVDGDGVVDLWPRFFLRFVPRPGQSVPQDSLGRPAQVLVPLVPNVAPYLGDLQGDVRREIAASTLQLFVVPLAQAVIEAPEGGQQVSPLGAIPVGDYEVWALNDEGGAWFLPNGLGQRSQQPVASQSLHVRVVHAAEDGGGTGP